MPLIRDLLQNELAIEVDQTLDPMTAVAKGAAIFAESRVWDEKQSTKKISRTREDVKGSINLTFDYPARVTTSTARLSVKPEGEVTEPHWIEIVDETGTTTGRSSINGPLRLQLNLRHDGENRFRIVVSGNDGLPITGLSREILITKAPASASSIPMTYTLAVKTQVGTVGYERNQLVPLVEKGTALPAEGRQRFKAGKTMRGGTSEVLNIELYDMAAGVTDPERNLHIGDFRLNADSDLERGEMISRGHDVIVHWRMSDSGALTLAVEIPDLGRLIDGRNFYFVEGGHINFEGEQGSQIASSLLDRAEKELNALSSALPEVAEEVEALRNKIEGQHAALSTSVEADVHRSVAEAARRIRQEVALLSVSPDNVSIVMSRDLAEAESDFDDLRALGSAEDGERHDKLVVSARRSLRDQDIEATQLALDEMKSIRIKIFASQPEFLVQVFRDIAEEDYLAVNPSLHQTLVTEGLARINENDVDGLRSVIGRIFKNRVSVGSGGANIVELAHLLGA
jgi:molecular chaperone DnaK